MQLLAKNAPCIRIRSEFCNGSSASSRGCAPAHFLRDRLLSGSPRICMRMTTLPEKRGSFYDDRTRYPRERRSLYKALRRPVIKLKTSTARATTSRIWIRLPAMWRLNPKSHKTSRTTKIVHSIRNTSLRITAARNPKSAGRPQRCNQLHLLGCGRLNFRIVNGIPECFLRSWRRCSNYEK
jgi:hypothetical protein